MWSHNTFLSLSSDININTVSVLHLLSFSVKVRIWEEDETNTRRWFQTGSYVRSHHVHFIHRLWVWMRPGAAAWCHQCSTNKSDQQHYASDNPSHLHTHTHRSTDLIWLQHRHRTTNIISLSEPGISTTWAKQFHSFLNKFLVGVDYVHCVVSATLLPVWMTAVLECC